MALEVHFWKSRLMWVFAFVGWVQTMVAFAGADSLNVDLSGDRDCAPSLASAIARLGPEGGRLDLGAGVCWLRSSVRIQTYVEIVGRGWHEGPGIGGGTWFKITEPGFIPFVLSGQGARGSSFRDLAVWQRQPALGDGWKPMDYPYVFDMSKIAGAVSFSHVLLAGVTRGLRSVGSGRLDVDGLYGQVYRTGVEIDDALDVPRVTRVHFWPYVSDDRRVMAFETENADAILSKRADNPVFEDIFALGMRSVFHFSKSQFGHTSKFAASDIDADLCTYGVLIDANGTDGSINNLYHQGDRFGGGSIAGSTAVAVEADGVVLRIANLDDRLSDLSSIRVRGRRDFVEMSNVSLQDWNRGGGAAFALDVAPSPILTDSNVLLVTNLLAVAGKGALFPNSVAGLHTAVQSFYAVAPQTASERYVPPTGLSPPR